MNSDDAVAVLGAGNWGTTIAHLIGENGFPVRLWSRDAEQVAEIESTRQNPRAMQGLTLSASVHADFDMGRVVRGAGAVILVVPSQAMREVTRALGDILTTEQIVVHASKGLELGSHKRMSEIIAEETCAKRVGVIAGPNIATEIAAGAPAGTVVTSRFPEVVRRIKRLLASNRFMVFAGADVIGVEMCGALKNVVAIAAGMATEMNVGENAMALLITRGLAEITEIASSFGAKPATLAGLAGVGDLTVTCRSKHSRNHRVGTALARGATLDEALRALGMVAEGVATSVAARELAEQRQIRTPLFEQVHRVLYGGISPSAALEELLRMPTGRDVAWS
jgi:glycerol-3-phosphate dehydrogenase (NAD(P)+)